MKKYVSVLPYLLLGLLWLVAVHLGNHSGLALMIDQRTGEKYCVDMLASYLGVPESDAIDYLGSLSVIFAIGMPFPALGLALWKFRRRRKLAG